LNPEAILSPLPSLLMQLNDMTTQNWTVILFQLHSSFIGSQKGNQAKHWLGLYSQKMGS
jgi:hypothetical protein